MLSVHHDLLNGDFLRVGTDLKGGEPCRLRVLGYLKIQILATIPELETNLVLKCIDPLYGWVALKILVNGLHLGCLKL